MVALSGPPSSPAAGWVYFDTSLGQLGYYSGSAWVYGSGGGGGATGTPFARNMMMALL